jgi:hypothetical protein
MRRFSTGVVLTPNTKTTLYTVPTKHIAEWSLLYAHNGTASAKNFSAWWYDASANLEIPVVVDYQLDAKEFLRIDGGAIVVLQEGDEVRAKIETGATDASVIITLDLIPQLSDIKYN